VTEGMKKGAKVFALLPVVSRPRSLRPLVANYSLQPGPAASVGDVVLVSLLVMPVLIYTIISATTRVSEYSSLNT
jgi:hypothetical protein